MLGDVAVDHPITGIAGIEEDVDRRVLGNKNRIFPDQVLIRNAVDRKYQEPLPMEMNGMLHRVIRTLSSRIIP